MQLAALLVMLLTSILLEVAAPVPPITIPITPDQSVTVTTTETPSGSPMEQPLSPVPLLVIETYTPTPTPTEKPIILLTPTLQPTKRPTVAPTPTPLTVSLYELINQWRTSTGRTSFVESPLSCQIATQRLPQVVKQFSHTGFDQMLPSLYANNPNLHSVAENLANASSAQIAFNNWLNSPTHRTNLESNRPFMCFRQSGRIFVQIFTDL
ncbi:CAP domain-containing protein [candidate division WWE3 bacterium]|nr:CAP domain-containing protein [candidate division WWE3 bacterium]